MPGTLSATFGVRTLTKAINTFADDALDGFFTRLFASGDTLRAEGETVEWDEVQMHRHLAPVTGADSPAPQLDEATRINRQSAMAHVKLYKDIPGRRLFHERSAGSLRPNAEEVIARELRDLQLAIGKTVEYMCAQSLLGVLTVNAANIPGSQVAFTINWGVNAHNFTAAWNLAGTNIVSSEIPLMTAAAVQSSGLNSGVAILNDVTNSYIAGNNEVQGYTREVLAADALAAGLVDDSLLRSMRLGGMDWIKDPGGYVPVGGAFTRFMATDRVIVLPQRERLSEVIGLALGRGIVPRSAFGGEGEMGIELAPSDGWYSYATSTENPAGVRLYAGWMGLPVILFPAGVTVATVV